MWSASQLSNLLAYLNVTCSFTISHQALPEAGAAVPFLLGDKGCTVPMVLSSPSPLAVDSLRPCEHASGPHEPQKMRQSSFFPKTCATEKLSSASLAWLSTQKGTLPPEDELPSQTKTTAPKIPAFPGQSLHRERKVASTIRHVDLLFWQTPPPTSRAVIQSQN